MGLNQKKLVSDIYPTFRKLWPETVAKNGPIVLNGKNQTPESAT